MKRIVAGVWVLLVCSLAARAEALEFEGVQLPERMQVAGQELQFNGAGMRSKLFFDIYVGALYLAAPEHDAGKVIGGKGARRVLMHFVYGELSRDKIVKSWNEGFEANFTKAELAAMRAGLDGFTALLGPVKRGDEVLIDFLPDGGTQVTFNGALQGTVPGNDIQRAVLTVWFGDHPADKSLKKGMLGGSR